VSDLTRWSPLVRWNLWALCASIPLVLLMAWDTGAHARSADEAMGDAFVMAPLILGLAVLALLTVVRAALSRALSGRDRALVIAVGLGVVPWVLVTEAIHQLIGDWHRDATLGDQLSAIALTAAWVLLALAARRVLHRGIPPGWPQLVRALWWMLCLLPPVLLFLALLNLVPGEDGPYRLWPFLLAACALVPLLVRRAVLDRETPRAQRVLVVLASLSVVTLSVLAVLAWHIGGAWPKAAGPGEWTFAAAVVLGSAALAVATRLALDR
jgi:hypothetical protein